jgi:hypothetical protein
MSLRYEQHRALRRSRDLLCDLLEPSRRPKTVKDLRLRVVSALRHFPMLTESGEPMWSQDNFTPPEGHEL